MLKRINYESLNSRQQENYNFQKLAAVLADYGYNCMWLNDDWQGADFIACHIDGNTVLKVQLKGRLTINQKYNGKDIHIAFKENEKWYLYPHDIIQDKLLELGRMTGTDSWDMNGGYGWRSIPKWFFSIIEEYLI